MGVEVVLEILEELGEGRELLMEDADSLGKVVEELLQIDVSQGLNTDFEVLVFGSFLGERNDHFLQKLLQFLDAFVLEVGLVLLAESPEVVVEFEVDFYLLLQLGQLQQVLVVKPLFHIFRKEEGVLLEDLGLRGSLGGNLFPQRSLNDLRAQKVVKTAQIEQLLVGKDVLQEEIHVIDGQDESLVVKFVEKRRSKDAGQKQTGPLNSDIFPQCQEVFDFAVNDFAASVVSLQLHFINRCGPEKGLLLEGKLN